jgi:hypothetical protein
MNSVGQSGDRKSYRIILLIAVGLTAFSSAMKELNLLREFTRDTNNLVASWSKAVAPETPQAPEVVPAEVPAPPAVPEVEVCDNSHNLPEIAPLDHVELGGGVAQADVKIKDVGKTVVAERSKRRNIQTVATLRADRSAGIELTELRRHVPRAADLKVMILADSDGEAQIGLPSGFEFKVPKVKTQRQMFKPEEREILRSWTRTFNVRSAG